jgi:pyruvate/2-oxoglutarate dehydrogenase complex dihydrolipoamide acyltransferase (E2) component
MSGFDLLPFPREREIVVDAGYLAARRHIAYGLAEVDVTEARARLHATPAADEAPLSFTAFIVASLGRAIAAHPEVQAYRDWRGRLVVFHDVDVVTLIEPRPGAVAIPHIIRQANSRGVRAISDEIRLIRREPQRSAEQNPRLMALAPYIPRLGRLLYFRLLKLNPHWFKQVAGTVVLTSIGMFAKGGAWGVTFLPTHNMGLTVGGIASKPGVHAGQIAVREYLGLTIAFDHDVVDGAPVARFSRALVELIETAAVLADDEDTGENTGKGDAPLPALALQ